MGEVSAETQARYDLALRIEEALEHMRANFKNVVLDSGGAIIVNGATVFTVDEVHDIIDAVVV